jgi:hypothetical protein
MTVYPHEPPPPIDTLVSASLKATLDPQRGRAAAAFRAHLAQTAAPPAPAPIPISAGRRTDVVPRRALWYWAGVPSLLAACLAVVVTLQFVNNAPPATSERAGPSAVRPAGTIAFDTPHLNQYEASRDVNDGVAMLDDHTPVRVIRRQGVRHLQWEDPSDHATYSLTEPVEKVGYVRIQPY